MVTNPSTQPIPRDASGSARFTVTEADTAAAVGSGSLPVLGTPRVLAWCEAVTCQVIEPFLAAGTTSVGTRVSLEHVAASPVGASVDVTASVAYLDGRLVRFTVSAREPAGAGGAGTLLASAEVTRVIVDSTKFMSRVDPSGGQS